MAVIRAVVFDLDDTLCLETDYVASGFRAVAREAARRSRIEEEKMFAFLWERFSAGARGDHFDRLLERYPELSQATSVSELIAVYRGHPPRLALLDGISEMLDLLESAGVRIGVITDGPVLSQTAKIRALGLESRIAYRVQTDEWGIEYRKPHVRAFVHIASQLEMDATQCVYVGDNPEKDFYGAKSLGWSTIRLRMSGQLRHALNPCNPAYTADAEVHSIPELTTLLTRYCEL